MHPNLPKGKLKALSALAWAVLFAYPNAHAQAQVADLATKPEPNPALTLFASPSQEPGSMSLNPKQFGLRSELHTPDLQYSFDISYAVFSSTKNHNPQSNTHL